jgi:hypothetical protein
LRKEILLKAKALAPLFALVAAVLFAVPALAVQRTVMIEEFGFQT